MDIELSTSKMSKGIKEGAYSGWDDPQLGTLKALRRRGVRPEALRRYWVETGIKDVEISFSWKTLHAFNRELIDGPADRYFFVDDPVKMKIEGAPDLTGRAPVHPQHPERGVREIRVGPESGVFVARRDLPEEPTLLRLKDLCNVEYRNETMHWAGNDLSVLKEGVKIIHWAPIDGLRAETMMPDGTKRTGVAEPLVRRAKGKVVQLERFGFAVVEEVEPTVRFVYTHD